MVFIRLLFFTDELFMAFVLSTRPHAKVLSVDLSKALDITGVHGYVDYKDIPGSVDGFIDQPFVTDKVSKFKIFYLKYKQNILYILNLLLL